MTTISSDVDALLNSTALAIEDEEKVEEIVTLHGDILAVLIIFTVIIDNCSTKYWNSFSLVEVKGFWLGN